MKRKNIFLFIAIVAVLALVFTGCSGKKESGGSAVSGSNSENQTAQASGGSGNIETKAGEVWVEDGVPSSGWVFENGIAYRANMVEDNVWKKNETNAGTYNGNTVIDSASIDYTANVNGNSLTLSKGGYSMTYTKVTGQTIQ